jgi:CubicO group peptidase (beta-lactamase class C family)
MRDLEHQLSAYGWQIEIPTTRRPGTAEGSVPGEWKPPSRRRTGRSRPLVTGDRRPRRPGAPCAIGGFPYAARCALHHGTGEHLINGRGRRASRPAGMTLWSLLLVAVVGLSGCSGSQGDMAGSAEGSATSPTAGSVPSGPSVGDSPTDTAAEVVRLVNVYVDVISQDAELIESLLVSFNGEELYTYYSADSGPSVAHNLYSTTKSVMSMLVGIAIGEGLITSVDQSLAELLPAHGPIMAPGVDAVTLRQLLTMTGGITDKDGRSSYPADADWTALTLATPLVKPAGSEFVYSDYGTHLISAILVEATGKSVLDYAREKLFNPLGISTEPATQPYVSEAELQSYDSTPGFDWATDPQGLNLGHSGLKITAPDMIKLGTLYLQQGQWEGQQLVPADWVRESTSKQIANDWSYGYLWWLPPLDDHPRFAALAWAGQVLEVVPDLNLVVAVSCTNPPTDGPQPLEAGSFAEMIDQQIVRTLTGG